MQRILNLSDRRAKEDVRDFSRVLEVVLYHEMGEGSFLESKLRAAKRYFQKKSTTPNHEIAVLDYLDVIMRKEAAGLQKAALIELQSRLDALGEKDMKMIPLIGLNEMKIWAEAKGLEMPIQAVFLDIVKENLKALG